MTRRFIYVSPFLRAWAALGLGEEDLAMLENALLEDPRMGDVIEGSGGVRKLRIRLTGRGKRGGGRVIYLDILEHGDLYMLYVYPKNKQDDLTPEQLKAIRSIADRIRKEYRA